jgi:hypothetical protein
VEKEKETLPAIDLNKQTITSWLHKDKITFLLSLNSKTHLSGQKKHIGWGSISEHVIACILSKLGIFKRAKEEKELKLFDPFVGSGTILLEALFGCIDYPKSIEQVGSVFKLILRWRIIHSWIGGLLKMRT